MVVESELKLLVKRKMWCCPTLHTWKTIWAVFRDEEDIILLYPQGPAARQNGELAARKIRIVEIQCCQEGGRDGALFPCSVPANLQSKLFTLYQNSAELEMTLQAESQEIRDKWLHAIQSQMSTHRQYLALNVPGIGPTATTATTADGGQPETPRHWTQLIPRQSNPEPDMLSFDYHKMYETINPLTCNIDQNRSLSGQLISQLITTMDLEKVSLPTCVLECRSLLESYADGFACPEYFLEIARGEDEWARFRNVLRFYLSTLKACRPIAKASKPYNPILGEIFTCEWAVPSGTSLKFLAEQISHHPPVSAVYAEHDEGITYTAHIHTRSGIRTKWLPPFLDCLSVDHVGEAKIRVLKHSEVYSMGFPSAMLRTPLSAPVLTVEGRAVISCTETKMRAALTFSGESLVSGVIYSGQETVGTMKGQWNGLVMLSTKEHGETVLVDMSGWSAPRQPKQVAPLALQTPQESRRLWRGVTRALAGYSSPISGEKAKLLVEAVGRRQRLQPNFFEVKADFQAEFKFALQEKKETLAKQLTSRHYSLEHTQK